MAKSKITVAGKEYEVETTGEVYLYVQEMIEKTPKKDDGMTLDISYSEGLKITLQALQMLLADEYPDVEKLTKAITRDELKVIDGRFSEIFQGIKPGDNSLTEAEKKPTN